MVCLIYAYVYDVHVYTYVIYTYTYIRIHDIHIVTQFSRFHNTQCDCSVTGFYGAACETACTPIPNYQGAITCTDGTNSRVSRDGKCDRKYGFERGEDNRHHDKCNRMFKMCFRILSAALSRHPSVACRYYLYFLTLVRNLHTYF